MSSIVFTDVEVDGRRVDVRVDRGRVDQVREGLRPGDRDDVIEGHGGALIPGLHDHHIHLLATAAAAASVQCGPPVVEDRVSLREALRSAPGDGWVRGVGYADSVAGAMDRDVLDELVPARPVRVQHRSGGLWVLNSAALRVTGLDHRAHPDVERDTDGRATGRLWRFDASLREHLDERDMTGLIRNLGDELVRYGITGVTDATPDIGTDALALMAMVGIPVVALGAADGADLPRGVLAGPRKILLRDHDLPPLDELVDSIIASHRLGRAVAVHCVTRESLVLTLLALEQAGGHTGDRIEHAAVVPPDVRGRIADLGVAVVTQPSFIALRGDDYLQDVDPGDVPCLYPYASLQAAGIDVATSSDAPYGDLDPWRSMVAARDRRTASGAVITPDERVGPARVLAGMHSLPLRPGGDPRRVAPGVAADLCLLDAALVDVLEEPDADRVRATVVRGEVRFVR